VRASDARAPIFEIMPDLTDTKTEKVAEIIREIHPSGIKNLLVVGCGSGLEAAILAQKLKAEVVGIDIKDEFDETAKKYAALETGDAENLLFKDETFDFVFSYHALEHIPNPKNALEEMRRVLKTGGGFWIGTPNKSRIIGYVGGKNTTLTQKINWNLMDWKARLTGKFENKFGAHAGFSAKELNALLTETFSHVEDRTKDYFRKIYANHPGILKFIEISRLAGFIYPSVYFSGRK
jgi:ubiquinone/menaquinone biosynthesis C-methylase UbiE